MPRRIAGVLTLAVLAPLTAEFLLGNVYRVGPPGVTQLLMLAVFVPFYGFGAVGVREIARRTGGGWPAILLLGLAFGLVQEGLLTQSLFNPDYLHMHMGDLGPIPFLGVSAPWAVYVLVLHPVWSIAAPIAVAERLCGTEPWLRRPGRWVTAVLYVLGAVATFATSFAIGHFLASPAQLLVTAVLSAALVVTAVRRRPRPASSGGGDRLGLGLGLVVTSAFQVVRFSGTGPWVTAVLMLLVVAVGAGLLAWLRPGAFGVGAGAVVTYWWVGMLAAAGGGVPTVVEQSVLVAATAVLMVVAARRSRTPGAPARVLAGSGAPRT